LAGVTAMTASFGDLADEIISVADIPGGTKLILSHELRQGYLFQVLRLETSEGRRELLAGSSVFPDIGATQKSSSLTRSGCVPFMTGGLSQSIDGIRRVVWI
jgi:hypothetical protein